MAHIDVSPRVAGFDANNVWHDPGNGQFAKPGWSTAKGIALSLIHSLADLARDNPDGIDARAKGDSLRSLGIPTGGTVRARYVDATYATIDVTSNGRTRRHKVKWDTLDLPGGRMRRPAAVDAAPKPGDIRRIDGEPYIVTATDLFRLERKRVDVELIRDITEPADAQTEQSEPVVDAPWKSGRMTVRPAEDPAVETTPVTRFAERLLDREPGNDETDARLLSDTAALFNFDLGDGYTSQTDRVRFDARGLHVTGVITDPDGTAIGTFTRVIEASTANNEYGGVEVAHSTLSIDPNYQGKGLGSKFLAASLDSYRNAGVDRVTVLAASSRGGAQNGAYTWAKAGFDWDIRADLAPVREIGDLMVARDKDSALGRRLRSVEDDQPLPDDFPIPLDVAVDPVGAEVLKSNDLGWSGVIALSDRGRDATLDPPSDQDVNADTTTEPATPAVEDLPPAPDPVDIPESQPTTVRDRIRQQSLFAEDFGFTGTVAPTLFTPEPQTEPPAPLVVDGLDGLADALTRVRVEQTRSRFSDRVGYTATMDPDDAAEVERFAARLFDHHTPTAASNTARIRPTALADGRPGFIVDGTLNLPDGTQIGVWERQIAADRTGDNIVWAVRGTGLTIAPEYRGQGYGPWFDTAADETLSDIGFDHIVVDAVTDPAADLNGAHTYATAGYDWDTSPAGVAAVNAIGADLLADNPDSKIGRALAEWDGTITDRTPTPLDVVQDPDGALLMRYGQTSWIGRRSFTGNRTDIVPVDDPEVDTLSGSSIGELLAHNAPYRPFPPSVQTAVENAAVVWFTHDLGDGYTSRVDTVRFARNSASATPVTVTGVIVDRDGNETRFTRILRRVDMSDPTAPTPGGDTIVVDHEPFVGPLDETVAATFDGTVFDKYRTGGGPQAAVVRSAAGNDMATAARSGFDWNRADWETVQAIGVSMLETDPDSEIGAALTADTWTTDTPTPLDVYTDPVGRLVLSGKTGPVSWTGVRRFDSNERDPKIADAYRRVGFDQVVTHVTAPPPVSDPDPVDTVRWTVGEMVDPDNTALFPAGTEFSTDVDRYVALGDDMFDNEGVTITGERLRQQLGTEQVYIETIPNASGDEPTGTSVQRPGPEAVDLGSWSSVRPWEVQRDPNSSDPADLLLNGERAPSWLRFETGHGQEAAHRGDHIVVTPKFFDLPESARRSVMYHEAGHGLSDMMLDDGSAFELVDHLPAWGHLNGQTTPGEIAAEAYAILWTEPEWLDTNAPDIRDIVTAKAIEHGYPLPDATAPTAGRGQTVAPSGERRVPGWYVTAMSTDRQITVLDENGEPFTGRVTSVQPNAGTFEIESGDDFRVLPAASTVVVGSTGTDPWSDGGMDYRYRNTDYRIGGDGTVRKTGSLDPVAERTAERIRNQALGDAADFIEPLNPETPDDDRPEPADDDPGQPAYPDPKRGDRWIMVGATRNLNGHDVPAVYEVTSFRGGRVGAKPAWATPGNVGVRTWPIDTDPNASARWNRANTQGWKTVFRPVTPEDEAAIEAANGGTPGDGEPVADVAPFRSRMEATFYNETERAAEIAEFEALPDDAMVVVFHGTSADRAANIEATRTVARSSREDHVSSVTQSNGLYVAPTYIDAERYAGKGGKVVEMVVPKWMIEPSPEAANKTAGQALYHTYEGAVIPEGSALNVVAIHDGRTPDTPDTPDTVLNGPRPDTVFQNGYRDGAVIETRGGLPRGAGREYTITTEDGRQYRMIGSDTHGLRYHPIGEPTTSEDSWIMLPGDGPFTISDIVARTGDRREDGADSAVAALKNTLLATPSGEALAPLLWADDLSPAEWFSEDITERVGDADRTGSLPGVEDALKALRTETLRAARRGGEGLARRDPLPQRFYRIESVDIGVAGGKTRTETSVLWSTTPPTPDAPAYALTSGQMSHVLNNPDGTPAFAWTTNAIGIPLFDPPDVENPSSEQARSDVGVKFSTGMVDLDANMWETNRNYMSPRAALIDALTNGGYATPRNPRWSQPGTPVKSVVIGPDGAVSWTPDLPGTGDATPVDGEVVFSIDDPKLPSALTAATEHTNRAVMASTLASLQNGGGRGGQVGDVGGDYKRWLTDRGRDIHNNHFSGASTKADYDHDTGSFTPSETGEYTIDGNDAIRGFADLDPDGNPRLWLPADARARIVGLTVDYTKVRDKSVPLDERVASLAEQRTTLQRLLPGATASAWFQGPVGDNVVKAIIDGTADAATMEQVRRIELIQEFGTEIANLVAEQRAQSLLDRHHVDDDVNREILDAAFAGVFGRELQQYASRNTRPSNPAGQAIVDLAAQVEGNPPPGVPLFRVESVHVDPNLDDPTSPTFDWGFTVARPDGSARVRVTIGRQTSNQAVVVSFSGEVGHRGDSTGPITLHTDGHFDDVRRLHTVLSANADIAPPTNEIAETIAANRRRSRTAPRTPAGPVQPYAPEHTVEAFSTLLADAGIDGFGLYGFSVDGDGVPQIRGDRAELTAVRTGSKDGVRHAKFVFVTEPGTYYERTFTVTVKATNEVELNRKGTRRVVGRINSSDNDGAYDAAVALAARLKQHAPTVDKPKVERETRVRVDASSVVDSGPMRIFHDIMGSLGIDMSTDETVRIGNGGQGALKPISEANQNLAETARAGLAVFPRSWTTALSANRPVRLQLRTGNVDFRSEGGFNRAASRAGEPDLISTPDISLRPDYADVAGHEFGHTFQHFIPGLLAAEQWHLMARLAANPAKSKPKPFGRRSRYGRQDYLYEDEFARSYSGRTYDGGISEAREVLTTAVQGLYTDSSFGSDPRLQGWAIGMMALLDPTGGGNASIGTTTTADRVAREDMTVAELLGGTFNADTIRAVLKDGGLTDTQRAALRQILDTLS